MTDGTPKPQPMGKEQISAFLLGNGWARDQQGHLRKQGAKRLFRIKFQEESVRMEVQSNGFWQNIQSSFPKAATLAPKGDIDETSRATQRHGARCAYRCAETHDGKPDR